MPHLTRFDEQFVHQIPLPLEAVAVHHQHWRESLFFVAHSPAGPGDVAILTLAHFPARREIDALQLGRIGDTWTMGRHARSTVADADAQDMRVGPVTIDIAEPYRRVELQVADGPGVPVALDLTFTARTAPYALRRGTMVAGHEVIWDQSHFVQSGTYRGTIVHDGRTIEVDDWWGQRDHSWGIRDHARRPLWIWLAIQLPEAMIALWHWELPNGARIYTDGCWAPVGGGEPLPVIDVDISGLHWIDAAGQEVSYDRDGLDVAGIEGRVELTFAGGRRLGLDAHGRWAQRYFDLGGGLNEVTVRSDDGQVGTGIYELTGAHHHRFFPVPRAEHLPPDG